VSSLQVICFLLSSFFNRFSSIAISSFVFFFAHILNGMRFLLLSLILTVISAALLPAVFSQPEKRIFFPCSFQFPDMADAIYEHDKIG